MNLKRIIKQVIRPTKIYNTVITGNTVSDRLDGKFAVVTGGSRGLGLEICKALLASGAVVVMTGRNKDNLETACNSMASDKIYFYEWDVCDIKNLEQKIEEILHLPKQDCRQLDIWVNNAGTLTRNDFLGNFFDITQDEYDAVMETNLKAVYFICQAVAKKMIAQNNKSLKHIINISSETAFAGAAVPYSISKWGVSGMVKGLGKILAPYGIVVNGVAPGLMPTDLVGRTKDDICLEYHPNKRITYPEEIADLVAFLASDIASNIVGQTILSDGGSQL